jgi:hypothetical protein
MVVCVPMRSWFAPLEQLPKRIKIDLDTELGFKLDDDTSTDFTSNQGSTTTTKSSSSAIVLCACTWTDT